MSSVTNRTIQGCFTNWRKAAYLPLDRNSHFNPCCRNYICCGKYLIIIWLLLVLLFVKDIFYIQTNDTNKDQFSFLIEKSGKVEVFSDGSTTNEVCCKCSTKADYWGRLRDGLSIIADIDNLIFRKPNIFLFRSTHC